MYDAILEYCINWFRALVCDLERGIYLLKYCIENYKMPHPLERRLFFYFRAAHKIFIIYKLCIRYILYMPAVLNKYYVAVQ
jgi:hypothetical protein